MATRRMQGIGDESGMALLFVLLIVTLLSALVLELSHDTLVDLRLAETFRDRTRAGYIARGGIVAGQMLLREDNNGYDHLNELWALGVSNYPVDEGSVSIEITDLGGRLDINRLVTSVGDPSAEFKGHFQRLFEHLGAQDPEGLTDALIDWIDEDNDAEPLGAENSYYRSLQPSYECKNALLDSFEELTLVRGFTPELLLKLQPHVTLHGSDDVNVNTATPEVLASLGAPQSLASDNLTLSDAVDLVEQLRAQPVTVATDLQNIQGSVNWYIALRPYLQVSSNNFRIGSRGEMNDAASFATAEFDRSKKNLYYLRFD